MTAIAVAIFAGRGIIDFDAISMASSRQHAALPERAPLCPPRVGQPDRHITPCCHVSIPERAFLQQSRATAGGERISNGRRRHHCGEFDALGLISSRRRLVATRYFC